jgi:hypothetical protein
MTDRSDLVKAIHAARNDGRALAQAVAALDAHEAARRDADAASRETDLGAQLVTARLAPVAAHELHTAATDWVAEFDLPADDGYRTAMIAEASVWYRGLDPAVKADPAELAEQARGRAGTLASAYAAQYTAARTEFLQTVGYLAQREGASGLPQIDQTVDPNNAPSATPYPTDVFPTFGEEQDPFNGVETNSHGSQADSARAPMVQQLTQQNSSGSGFGSGPERPAEHSTGFDTADSYAEVPLGPPGQIGTTPPATDRQVGSAPNPVAGTPQDAGADKRQTVATMAGYSVPDPSGYRWPMTTEIMHPFHERCASAHWPDESCGGRAHTASVAIGYTLNLDQAHRAAQCERIGATEGLRAIASAATVGDLAARHNRVAAAWATSGQGSPDDTAVLHGFMAVVRPVLAERGLGAGGVTEAEREGAPHHLPGTDKFPVGSAADVRNAKHDIGRTSEPHGKVVRYIDEMAKEYGVAPVGGSQKAASLGGDAWGRLGFNRQGASSLTQIQQTVDPDNQDTPQDDQLPDGVAFPINDSFAQQWVTGPGGAQPRGGQKEAAIRQLPTNAAQMFGRMDALDGNDPWHRDNFPWSTIQHGRYLRSWNTVAGGVHGMTGRAPMSREEYSGATGRPDLHQHYMSSYAEGRKAQREPRGAAGDETTAMQHVAGDSGEGVHPDSDRCIDCGHLRGCDCPHQCEYPDGSKTGSLRATADAWSQPRQTTDDAAPPYNSPATAPQPASSNAGPQDGDYSAGAAAARADKAAGQRPAFADNSSGVSPYVKGYAEAYGAPAVPQGVQDVPGSLGGDSGQPMLDQEAQQAFQRSKASLRRASAAFAPDGLFGKPDFTKGYRFASQWKPGQRLVSQGSAEFEAGLYAGVTDRPRIQQMWLAAHAAMARRHPALGRRIELHSSFTGKTARRQGIIVAGTYLTAGVSTDLITDGPGTSPDPMGATPLNGPGTPPPMGGRDEAATPGGAPPYQGAPPMPGGPVVPDDVMGRPQQPAQPDGPFTNTFSGDHPENTTLAPVAPDSAAQPGYSNRDAYKGDPAGGDRVAKLAAFRTRVQAGLAAMNGQEAAR